MSDESPSTFAGARVLVTGAASGLGAALTEAWRVAGAEVLATDRAADWAAIWAADWAAEETSGRDPRVVRLDVTSEDDWAEAVRLVEDRWGGLDILVNNAGVAGGGRIEQCPIHEWQRLIDINLLGVVRGTRAFTPLFKRQRSGHLVNVASLAGLVHPAGMGSYNAVKAAVVAFTETMGHELASYGVTAHAVCPSYFRTNLMSSLAGEDAALASVMKRLVEEAPLGAQDIATAVLAGLAEGHEVILPDEAARAAFALKRSDPDGYAALMRAQAAELEEIG